MQIRELYRKLSYGELANLSLAGEGTGVIIDSARPRVINYANEGLLRLHSRFVLRQNFLYLEMVEHLAFYYMLKRYAKSEITDPPCENIPHHYILDTENEPFEDDVIKVLEVRDRFGSLVPLNDLDDPKSVFTPQPNLIQIPNAVGGEVLSIAYQARHPELDYLDDCAEIDLPYTLEGALTAFIGYKFYSHMNGQENTAKAAEFMQIFESICLETTTQDLVSQTQGNTFPMKFEERGFI